MSELLTRTLSRLARRPAHSPDATDLTAPGVTASAAPQRPLALGAAAVGVAAPGIVLLLLWAVGLVGWFADNGGSNSDTRAVLRVAADAWLLGHGAALDLQAFTVTAAPWGLTLLCAGVVYRLACWAGRTSAVEDLRAAGLGLIVLSGVYGVVALVVALVASAPGASPDLTGAFFRGGLLAAALGGPGLLRGAGLLTQLRRRLPIHALAVGYAAATTLVLLLASGALLAGVALALRGPAAARVAEELDLDLTGGLLSVLLAAAIVPNLSALAVSYLLGPGFAFGTGTVVSPREVDLGPLPSVPVLAALPESGWAPEWLLGLQALPVLLAAVACVLVGRVLTTSSYRVGLLRGLGAGALAAVLVTVLLAAAGGAIGPARMTEIGVPVGAVLQAASLRLVGGALLGALAATWWARRTGVDDAAHHPALPVPPLTRPRTRAVPPVEPEPLAQGRPLPRWAPSFRPAAGPRSSWSPDPDDLSQEHTTVVQLPAQPGSDAPGSRR